MRLEVFRALTGALADERAVAVATVLSGPAGGEQALYGAGGLEAGGFEPPALAAAVGEAAAGALAARATGRRTLELAGGPVELFVEVHVPRPQLVVVGAVHAAIPLVHFANLLGFRTLVVDPRTAFATPERFAHADRLVTLWPDRAFADIALNESTYVALLSHDLKLDLPALRLALAAPVAYVGALGSKKTHAKRVTALRDEGFDDDAIGRVHAPIGLPLGGRRPEEIAVSVIAEIVAVANGKRLRAD